MSKQDTPAEDNTAAETMETEVPTQEVAEASLEAAAPAKAKKAKAPDASAREPGKSVLPFSRVQKILKADKDLVMVQREAAFLISRATEEFIGRFAEAAQRHAGREGRSTVQPKDVVVMVRRVEEFAFLEELFPWSSAEPTVKRKPKNNNTQKGEIREPTMLDQFVSRPLDGDGEEADEDEGPGKMDIVESKDGTLSMVPAAESEPS